MTILAAIDIGSNAMRLGIASVEQGEPTLIARLREPVRLGRDAFTTGRFSEDTMQSAEQAFANFRRLIDQHHAERIRAVATSAMRETANAGELIARIHARTGIQIECISGEEEARLIHRSIARQVKLEGRLALAIDIGGGSVEVTLCDNGEPVAAQSFRIGTVRLLEMLRDAPDFGAMLREYLDGARKKLREHIGGRKPDFCLGTGGNATAIGELAHRMLDTASPKRLERRQLKKLIARLEAIPVEERIRKLGLRPDRADVILPAAMVFHDIMKLARADEIRFPDASLLEGILLCMAESPEFRRRSRERQMLAWAASLKNKYHVDLEHARTVARLARELFDQLADAHELGKDDRLLLTIAAELHEIGMYVRVGGYHRHSAYLISASPMLGLDADEQKLLALVVRHQRKAGPDDNNPDFAALNEKDKTRVWRLSALLRLAIALNKERRDRVRRIKARAGEKSIALSIEGDGDLMLERWAVSRLDDYFRKALGRKLRLDMPA